MAEKVGEDSSVANTALLSEYKIVDDPQNDEDHLQKIPVELIQTKAPEFNIKVGDKFTSFDELNERIKQIESESFTQLVKRDSKTLEYASKNSPKRVAAANKTLVYFSIFFSCVFGGRRYKPEGCGKRKAKTKKQDCKAGIKLNLSKDGTHLIVTDVINEHNHEVSEDIYLHLPKQRRLDTEDLKAVKEMLKLNMNKRVLTQHIQVKTGKRITLKDLRNIKNASRTEASENDLEKLIQRLNSLEGSAVEFHRRDKRLTGLLFQDKEMRAVFQSYPEIAFVSLNHESTNMRIPLFAIFCIDSMGQVEIAAIFLTIVMDTKEALSTMMDGFKKHNPHWTKTRAVFGDEDMLNLLRLTFSGAYLFTYSLFNTLRSFKAGLVNIDFKLTDAEQYLVVDIFQKLLYSKSEDEYQKYYEVLKTSRVTSFVDYYETWHDRRREWVETYRTHTSLCLGEKVNRKIEGLSQKIDAVCCGSDTLNEFFEQFLNLLIALRNDRDAKVYSALVKKAPFDVSDVERQYFALLTPFAYSLIRQQFENIKFIRPVDVLDRETDCACMFRRTSGLPCVHILTCRSHRFLPMFCPELVEDKWTRHYADLVPVHYELRNSRNTQVMKLRKATEIAKELLSMTVLADGAEFKERLKTLHKLKEIWESGSRALVSNEGDQPPNVGANVIVNDASSTVNMCCDRDYRDDERGDTAWQITNPITLASCCAVLQQSNDPETQGHVWGQNWPTQ